MKRYNDAREDFLRLIASDEETNGSPVLPDGSRKRLECAIELVLLNVDAWSAHLTMLATNMTTERNTWLLSAQEHASVVENGLSALPDSRLAAFVLNRFGLIWLARDIDDAMHGEDVDYELPETWVSIMSRHGRELIKENRVPLGDASLLLDAAFRKAREGA